MALRTCTYTTTKDSGTVGENSRRGGGQDEKETRHEASLDKTDLLNGKERSFKKTKRVLPFFERKTRK